MIQIAIEEQRRRIRNQQKNQEHENAYLSACENES